MLDDVTIFIPVRHRLHRLESLLSLWLNQCPNIIVWDDSDTFSTEQPVRVIRCSDPIGSCVKFRGANLVRTPFFCAADDDVMPEGGFLAEMKDWQAKLHGVVSIFGRKLGPKYRSHPLQRADEITAPVDVDFVGQWYLGRTGDFLVPMQGCHDYRLDDLYWSYEARRKGVRLSVVPSKRWHYEGQNEAPICGSKGYWDLRDRFVQEQQGK